MEEEALRTFKELFVMV